MTPAFEELRAEDETVRIAALRKLPTLDAAELEEASVPLVESLSALLQDPSSRVTQAALETIGLLAHRLGLRFGPKVVSSVFDLGNHTAPAVRAEAAVALALLDEIDRTRAIAALDRLLVDEAPEVRREAAAALGDLSALESKEALAKKLEDSDEDVRFEAAFALANLGDTRALGVLRQALQTSRRRIDAVEAIGRLGSQGAVGAVRPLARGFFVAWPERLYAAATLHRLGSEEGAQILIERSRSWNREERQLALALIGSYRIEAGGAVLEAAAMRGRKSERLAAIRALGELGGDAHRPTLERLLLEDGLAPELRREAEEALEKLRDGKRTR